MQDCVYFILPTYVHISYHIKKVNDLQLNKQSCSSLLSVTYIIDVNIFLPFVMQTWGNFSTTVDYNIQVQEDLFKIPWKEINS